MINAETLMAGNILMMDSPFWKDASFKPLRIVKIWKKQDTKTSDEYYAIGLETFDEMDLYGCKSYMLKPISITAEWLEKLGFKYNHKLDGYVLRESKFGSKYSFRLHKNDNGFFSLHTVYGKKIEFVHELQNHLNINFDVKLEIK